MRPRPPENHDPEPPAPLPPRIAGQGPRDRPRSARRNARPGRRKETPRPERHTPPSLPRSQATHAGADRSRRSASPEGPPPARAGRAERNRPTPGQAPKLHTLNNSPGPGPAHRRPEPSPPAGDRPTVAPAPGEIGPRTSPRQNAQKRPIKTVQLAYMLLRGSQMLYKRFFVVPMLLYSPTPKNRATAIFALKPYKARKQEKSSEILRKHKKKPHFMPPPVRFLPDLPYIYLMV